MIVGMHTWTQAVSVAELMHEAQVDVPTISFVAPSITPPLMPIRWPSLVRLTSSETNVKCIADMVHVYNWHHSVVAIYEDDTYGGDSIMLALISEALQDVSMIIEYHLALPSPAYLPNPRCFIHEELFKLIEHTQPRIFVV